MSRRKTEGSAIASSRFPAMQVEHAGAIRGVQKAVMLAVHCETTAKRKWVKRFSCQLPRLPRSKRAKRRRRKIVVLNTFWRSYLLDQQLRLSARTINITARLTFQRPWELCTTKRTHHNIHDLKYMKQILNNN